MSAGTGRVRVGIEWEGTERRINARCPVEDAASIRPMAARNQARPAPRSVTVLNVSITGAGLQAAGAGDLVAGHTIELGIEGAWSRCRVAWAAPGVDGSTVAGVEFVERTPRFLPALLRWIEREQHPPN
jgi:hypothetical protein